MWKAQYRKEHFTLEVDFGQQNKKTHICATINDLKYTTKTKPTQLQSKRLVNSEIRQIAIEMVVIVVVTTHQTLIQAIFIKK